MPRWFETGSPTFLFRMMMDREVSPMELGNLTTDAGQLSKFDVEDKGNRGISGLDIDLFLVLLGHSARAKPVTGRCAAWPRQDYIRIRAYPRRACMNPKIDKPRAITPIAANSIRVFGFAATEFPPGRPIFSVVFGCLRRWVCKISQTRNLRRGTAWKLNCEFQPSAHGLNIAAQR